MVQSVNDYANNRVMIMPIKVWAAVDFEPDWSTYGIAYTWIQAYSHTGASDYLNFGSTDGYPAPAPGDPAPVVPPSWGCCSSWNTAQLFHISYGLSLAFSLPEIYMPQYARNWNRVKRWSIESGQTRPLSFGGEMSECATSPCGQAGNTVFFAAQEAWQVFWLQLNADPQTRQNSGVATDIKCSNGNSGLGCRP
jgi:hypothetical protein